MPRTRSSSKKPGCFNKTKPSLIFTDSPPLKLPRRLCSPLNVPDNPVTARVMSLEDGLEASWVSPQFQQNMLEPDEPTRPRRKGKQSSNNYKTQRSAMASQLKSRSRKPVLKDCSVTPGPGERRLPKGFQPLDFVAAAPRSKRSAALGDEDTLQDISVDAMCKSRFGDQNQIANLDFDGGSVKKRKITNADQNDLDEDDIAPCDLSENCDQSMRFTKLRTNSTSDRRVKSRMSSAVNNPKDENGFDLEFPGSAWNTAGNVKEIQTKRLSTSRQRNKGNVDKRLANEEGLEDFVHEEMDIIDHRENHLPEDNSQELSIRSSASAPESPIFDRRVKETTPSVNLSRESPGHNLNMNSIARKHRLFSEVKSHRAEGTVLVADTPEAEYSLRVSLRQRRHLLPPSAAERLLMNF